MISIKQKLLGMGLIQGMILALYSLFSGSFSNTGVYGNFMSMDAYAHGAACGKFCLWTGNPNAKVWYCGGDAIAASKCTPNTNHTDCVWASSGCGAGGLSS